MNGQYFVRKIWDTIHYITVLYRNDTIHYTYCIVSTLPVAGYDRRGRIPSAVFGHLLPILRVGKEGDQA